MAMHEPNWDLYRTFLAVLEHGSLSAAARALGLTQPTVGRHIDELQEQLGIVLFTRSQSGLVPTDTAIGLRPYAEALRSTAKALQRAASAERGAVQGTVRITAAEVVGIEVLPPILTGIRNSFPDLEFELVLSNLVENLLRRDADIAVRMVAPNQDSLIAQKTGTVEIGFYATRGYLAQSGWADCHDKIDWSELVKLDLIGFDTKTADIRSIIERNQHLGSVEFDMRVDSNTAQLAMMRAGFGVALCQSHLAARSGDCIRLIPEFSVGLDTWITMHEGLRDTLRCRMVFDALVTGMKSYVRDGLKGLSVPPVGLFGE